MSKLRLSIAVGNYDRTRALIDGTVGIDGVDPVVMTFNPEEMFFRGFRHAEFAISELSLSSFALRTARGDCPYVGVPAFVSRGFRHTSIYVRTDRITKPEDLRGKRIGLAEYQLTANVWVRALLEDEYGVKPSDIQWLRGGLEETGRIEKVSLELPNDVSLENIGPDDSLAAMLDAGEIDGLIGPRAPSGYRAGSPNIGRLFPDSRAAADDYYSRTGIFPIMHVVGVRRDLVESHPWLPAAVLKAFAEAKQLALDELEDLSALKTMLPGTAEELERAQSLMGKDFWSYGVSGNEPALETFLRHHYSQGLSPRLLQLDELFYPTTFESYRI